MVKLISFAYLIFLTSYCQQTCADPISLLASVVPLEAIVRSLLTLKDESGNIILRKIGNKNAILNKYFLKMEYLKMNPYLLNYVYENTDFLEHLKHLNHCYDLATEMQKRFNKGKSFMEDEYNDKCTYSDYQKDFDYVYGHLLGTIPELDFMPNFFSVYQKYLSVCNTGTSNQLVLVNMLEMVKIATAQYYVIDAIRQEMLYIHKDAKYLQDNKQEIENAKDFLKDKINERYGRLVTVFQILISQSSREVYKCDTPKYKDVIRYENKPDSSYFEIAAFQNSADWVGSLEHGCSNIDRLRPNKNFHHTRPCEGELVDCFPTKNHVYCLNAEGSQARFSHIFHFNQSLKCEVASVVPLLYSICDCVCNEKKFYINITPQHAAFNKVVTGARFVVKSNVLYLQIEQGYLLPNGTINNTEWISPDTVSNLNNNLHFVEVKWNFHNEGVRGFNLIKLEQPGSVIKGLSLAKNPDGRIGLNVYFSDVDLRTGQLGGTTLRQGHSARNNITKEDCDVPTKGPGENDIISNDNDYIYFTLSSRTKDGGQSVVPFIDGQTVAPKERVPLSGAALIYRGQEGYGGFLGIKLYTFDVTPYIVKHESLGKPPKFFKSL